MEWSDRTPTAYREQYGIGCLRDRGELLVGDAIRDDVMEYASRTVS